MRTRRVFTVLAASALLVTGFDAATYGATGHSLILGQINKAGQTTTVTNTGKGPALRLITQGGAAPLTVGSDARVRKLNADQLDGWDSSELLTRSYVLTDADTSTTRPTLVSWTLSDVPAGRYLLVWNAALSPLPNGTTASCALTTMPNYTDIVAPDHDIGGGGWSATWLSGSAVVDFDPEVMQFFCQTTAPGIRLTGPLTVAFTATNMAQDLPLTPAPVPTARAPRGGPLR